MFAILPVGVENPACLFCCSYLLGGFFDEDDDTHDICDVIVIFVGDFIFYSLVQL